MKRIFYCLSILLLISCGNSKNSPEFMEAAQGRYLFNSNETLKISFVEGEMSVNWRNQDVKPVKLNDSSFYLKEMNEKLVFLTKPEVRIELAEKAEHKGKKYTFIKLSEGEKTPSEYFNDKEYDKALVSYKAVQKRDSLDRSVSWRHLNNTAHGYFDEDQKEEAFELFKINIALYPNKPAAYRNYGYALMETKDTIGAVKNYRTALAIDPNDQRALAFFERIQSSTDD